MAPTTALQRLSDTCGCVVEGQMIRSHTSANSSMSTSADQSQNRPLSKSEYALCHSMLERGSAEARTYFDQLDLAEVTPWRCACGCASINFHIKGREPAPPGVHVLSEFVFGEQNDLCGIFIYSCDGTLSGLEVYGLSGDAAKILPDQSTLRTLEQSAPK
jgi:hypothetical protein